MAENERFTDAIVSEPLPTTREELDHFYGSDAYRLGHPRDPRKSAAWLEGYDRAAAKWTDDAIRRHTTAPCRRDAGPVEILVLCREGQKRLAIVAARNGVVATLEGDAAAVEQMLDPPLQILRGHAWCLEPGERPDLITDEALRHLRAEIEAPGRDGQFIFIDGRIDGAGWVEALPLSLTGTYVRARRVTEGKP